MIPAKFTPYVFSLLMAFFMSSIMSFVVTTCNVGFVPELLDIWFDAWQFAIAVAIPTIFVVSPCVRKLVGVLTEQPA
ncbi:MAG: DUF2798 domain-containing protein [Pontibacterium sp.]